jgi:hypothetical protein
MGQGKVGSPGSFGWSLTRASPYLSIVLVLVIDLRSQSGKEGGKTRTRTTTSTSTMEERFGRSLTPPTPTRSPAVAV